MLWVPVLSTEISHARYDPDAGALRIRFRSGEVCEYYGVPKRVYDMLLAAPSHGRYFHQRIKDRYDYARIR